jgi:hypothetical protein
MTANRKEPDYFLFADNSLGNLGCPKRGTAVDKYPSVAKTADVDEAP